MPLSTLDPAHLLVARRANHPDTSRTARISLRRHPPPPILAINSGQAPLRDHPDPDNSGHPHRDHPPCNNGHQSEPPPPNHLDQRPHHAPPDSPPAHHARNRCRHRRVRHDGAGQPTVVPRTGRTFRRLSPAAKHTARTRRDDADPAFAITVLQSSCRLRPSTPRFLSQPNISMASPHSSHPLSPHPRNIDRPGSRRRESPGRRG